MAEPTSTTLRPRPWYLLLLGVAVVVGVLVIGLVFAGATPVVAVCGGIGCAMGMAWTMRLTVDEQGITMQRKTLRWEEAELKAGKWGESLVNPAAERRQRVQVFLPIYQRDWRSEVIGDVARRRAPLLLESPPQSSPA